ncbi:MAG: response regulator [Candidatus Thermoplasmatota archaeon]
MEEKDEDFKILIAEDENSVRKSLRMTLERAEDFSAEIETASDGEEALKKVEEKKYDLVLSDHKMPGMTGVELLKNVMKIRPKAIRILITGYRDLNIAKEAINEASVHEYIEKPWENEELRATVHRKLKRKEERETEDIKEVENVDEGVRTLKERQEEITKSPGGSASRETLAFELETTQEFNKFSFELKKINNAKIEDVDVFENKYIVRVSILPSTYDRIK